MLDIANLGIKFESGTVVDATDRFKKFQVEADGAEKSADKVSGAMKKLAGVAGSVAGALAGALSIAAIAKAADAWSDMQSKVGAAIKSMDDAPRVMRRLVDLANASYSSLDQTVAVYARNVGVLRQLGLSADQAADYTESLNHMLVITATKGERAASVQDALSKAMAVGKLQADGLETVLANGGRVAEALAGQLGTTVNGLRQMASDGKITASVMANALLKSLQDVRTEAAEMPATIADGFTRIATGFTALVGLTDQLWQSSGAVAGVLLSAGDALLWLADNAAFASGYIAAAGLALVGYATYVAAAAVATLTLSGALAALKYALIATGFGAFIVLAGTALGYLFKLVEATGSWGEAFALFGRVAAGVWEGFIGSARAVPDALKGVWLSIKADFMMLIADLIGAWGKFLYALGTSAENAGMSGVADRLFAGMRSAYDASGEWGDEAVNAAKASSVAFENAANTATAGWEKAGAALTELKAIVTSTTDAVAGGGDTGGGGGGGAAVDPASSTGGGGKAGKSLKDAFTELQGSIAVDVAAANLEYQNGLAILEEARAAGLVSRAEYNAMVEGMQAQHVAKLQNINDQSRSIEIAAQNQMFSSLAGMLGTFGAKSKAAALAALAINTWIRVRETLQNATSAAWQAYAAAGPVGGPAAFASVMAMGKASAAFIVAQGIGQALSSGGGGGGGKSSGGGTASSGSGASTATQTQAVEPLRVSIDAIDPSKLYSGAAIIGLFDNLQKEAGNRGIIWPIGAMA